MRLESYEVEDGQLNSRGYFRTLGLLGCLRELWLKSQWSAVFQTTLWYSPTIGVSARITT
jgi:hypothetical protein